VGLLSCGSYIWRTCNEKLSTAQSVLTKRPLQHLAIVGANRLVVILREQK